MNRMNTRQPRYTAIATSSAALAVLLLASGCAAQTPDSVAGDDLSSTLNADGSTSYPVTVKNCGVDVTFDEAPSKVVLLESAPVAILYDLGVLDAVVMRAGPFPAEYYDDSLNAAIEKIPSLGDSLDNSGHLQISQEVVIAEQPDVVMGLPDGITREGLGVSGIRTLLHPVYCPEGVESTSFQTLYDQISEFGLIFDRNAEAAALNAELTARVSAVESAVAGAPERTAAVLYPIAGGGTGYAYGSSSMAQPQLEAAGFTNVFADVDERVFEVSLEELIARDPDVLVLLYTDGDPVAIKEAVTALPGADALRAVASDNILVQLFNFTEPPTPVSVDGLERIVERFGTGK